MASSQSTELTTARQAPPPRDVNQLSDAELRHIVQTMTSATRMRMHRILTEYMTPARCQQPCGNPDCGHLCNRRVRLLALVSLRGGIILFENPTSSLTWKTQGSDAWMRQFTPYLASVAACAHGMNAFKSWLFCCNHPDVMRLASVCSHPKGTHPSLSGKRSSDGTFLTRLTALYPQSLANAIADIFKSALSVGEEEVPFLQWERLLPARLPFSVPKRRIEDGCGTCSSASWVVPHEPDAFSGLRQAWCDTLRSTGLLPQILQRLGSSDKAAPLSDAELQPFLSALRHWLGVPSEAVWNACLEVNSGQPFRLHLWRILAEISRDPDSRFTDQLVSGVSLGVHCPLRPCTVMAPGLPPDADPRPLECCTSAWQSALRDSATVDELLQEELQQGWIREVPGGLFVGSIASPRPPGGSIN